MILFLIYIYLLYSQMTLEDIIDLFGRIFIICIIFISQVSDDDSYQWVMISGRVCHIQIHIPQLYCYNDMIITTM